MTRPTVIGLTGSIGMGKTTTAKMFEDYGVQVWNADEAVHRLYSEGGAGVREIAEICPDVVLSGKVDRKKLRHKVTENKTLLAEIERRIHPLVAEDRRRFLDQASSDIVLLDVPLLFETGLDRDVDQVVVVSVDLEEQRRRVLERQNMSEEQFQAILSKQMPDIEKRRKADHVINTDTLETARRDVHSVIEQIRSELKNA